MKKAIGLWVMAAALLSFAGFSALCFAQDAPVNATTTTGAASTDNKTSTAEGATAKHHKKGTKKGKHATQHKKVKKEKKEGENKEQPQQTK